MSSAETSPTNRRGSRSDRRAELSFREISGDARTLRGFTMPAEPKHAVSPSPSYNISLPVSVKSEFGGIVASFYRPGEQTLLQLSSYVRSSGDQVGALVRLHERISKDARTWRVWKEQLHADQNVDQAAADYLDQNGWAREALRGVRLTVN